MQFKGLLYYVYVNMRYSLIIFWLILCGILLLSIGGNYIGSEDTTFYFTFSLPIYIFSMIMGHWMVNNVIPYTLKMGSTRMNIYLGYALMFILLSVFNAVIANTINSIITNIFGEASQMMEFTITEGNETTIVNINHIADLVSENDWFHRVMIDTSISFLFIAASFVIGLVFYRFRLLGGFAFLGILSLLFLFAASKGWIWEFIQTTFQDFSFNFFYQLFGVGIIIYIVSYLILRKITV